MGCNTHEEVEAYCIDSFLIVVVASRKRVSWGAILRKTTLDIEDFPLLDTQRNTKVIDSVRNDG